MAKDQPEALATFAASARNEGQKPKDTGLHATGETEAIPTDPKKKADAATKVLREGINSRLWLGLARPSRFAGTIGDLAHF